MSPATGATARGPGRAAGFLDQVLHKWGINDPGPPDPEALDRLHRAYLLNVPFENATKLVKASRAKNADACVRGPVEFWKDHLRLGSGGTCFASTSAYQFLLRYLGYTSKLLFCQLPAEKPQAHAALWVQLGGEDILVDVGYALPAPMRLAAKNTYRATPYYDIEARPGPNREYLVFSEDDRGSRFRYRFVLEAAPDPAYLKAWHGTFDLKAPYMRRLALGRFTPTERFLYKDAQHIFSITRAGERELSIESPPVPHLSRTFGLPGPLLTSALAALESIQNGTSRRSS